MTDPIADYLTRLRNAIKAQHRVVEIPSSKLKRGITKILFEQGYILNYKFIEGNVPGGTIKIALKYDPIDKVNAIKSLQRVSRPSSPIHWLQGHATRAQWFRHRHHFYIKGLDDQQGSKGSADWW